jgi:hypothetical protein
LPVTERVAALVLFCPRGSLSRRGNKMEVWESHDDLADKLREQEERPEVCPTCGKGKLQVLDEVPDPTFGTLGVVQRTLKCDAPQCGQVRVI